MRVDLFLSAPYKPADQLSPLVLAYIGDAVYELFIRQYLISLANYRPHDLHRRATAYVSAKAQARALKHWLPLLSREEAEIVKRGRNAKSGSSPKNTGIIDYRHSTGFECLIGYLYCEKRFDRLTYLMHQAVQCLNERADQGNITQGE